MVSVSAVVRVVVGPAAAAAAAVVLQDGRVMLACHIRLHRPCCIIATASINSLEIMTASRAISVVISTVTISAMMTISRTNFILGMAASDVSQRQIPTEPSLSYP